ncbi:MerR family transcriptional regulator [Rhodoblastus sp.]|uniref:MerR family transcriptional regulator n=1 Tax=Rhodoblastus sp. TaxID=1962975 RepID=UPI0035AFC7DE
MDKTQDAFRTIGEVAEELDLPQHVLRFWETKFSQIRPVKRAGGRRYYRPEDVQLVAAIRILLYSEGYTIRGVQRILKEQGARAVVAASRAGGRGAPPPPEDEDETVALPGEVMLAEADGELGESSGDGPAFVAQPAAPDALVPGASVGASLLGATRLSAQDRHRMEAILAELVEGGRILDEARRG